MRAVCLTAFTGLDGLVLTDVAVPTLAPDEVLVEVRTVGANQLDLNTMIGRGPGARTPLPLVLGIDPAGVVVAQGTAVGRDRLGENVVVKPNISCGTCRFCLRGAEADCPAQLVTGVHRPGGAADLVAVPSRNAFGIGELDFAQATAAVHSVPIALHAINAAGGVDVGISALVTGATGAVGAAAVQLLHRAGARVLAASTSRTVTYPGVTPLRYTAGSDLVRAVRAEAPAGVDLVVDGTGHGPVVEAAVACLAWAGRLVVCAASTGPQIAVDTRTLYLQRQRLIGAASADYREVHEALALVRAGAVHPPVGATFPLERAREAYEAIADRSRNGKVVIQVG